MKKGHTNNPNGRPKVDDKKVMIGIYVPESLIKKHGKGNMAVGKEAIRIQLKYFLGLNK